MPRQKSNKTHRSDLKYKEIRRLLARKEREKRDQTVTLIEEFYVDSSRMISVQMGGVDDDLKTMIQTSGIKSSALADLNTGEPNAKAYVRLAHYHIKAGRFDPALYYLEVALSMNTDSLYAMASLARCHLLMGHWVDAMKAAEIVMSQDRKNILAILVKAEALYNSCFFEHALVMFYRGQGLAPDNEDFRLGVQKCQKTIQDTVAVPGIFKVPGVRILFRLLGTAQEMHNEGVAGYANKKKKGVSFKGLMSGLSYKTSGLGAVKEAMAAKKLEEVADILNAQAPLIDAKAEMSKATSKKTKPKTKTKMDQEKIAKKKKAVAAESKKKPKESITKMLMNAEMKSEGSPSKAKKSEKSKFKPTLGSGDRLLEDKIYLTILAEGGIGTRSDIAEDRINGEVSFEAQEALDFLNTREKFWDQVELGKEKKMAKSNEKALESFRWLM